MKARFLRRLWLYPKAIYFSLYTLTYNAFRSDSPLADIVFEPVFWIVDHFAGALGKALVILVVCLITAVVLIFYVFVIPIVLEYNVWFMVCHLLCGHWLLLNVTFHYYKACSTSPGHPPILDKKATTIQNIQVCTKCIQQKPLRAHHCSVCNKCILKMDHHCPWVNNCIGHFNHRYFFLFCLYMCLGTIYVSVTTFPKFLEHLNIHAKNMFKDYFIPTSGGEKYLLSNVLINENKESIHNFILFEFMLCSCVSVAVGGLALWHGILISRGETSIETYINKSQRQQMKKEGCKFVNPYHYGCRNNWKMALGLQNGRGIWSVLLPSSHPPWGNGVGWSQLPDAASYIKMNNHTQEGDKGAFMA